MAVAGYPPGLRGRGRRSPTPLSAAYRRERCIGWSSDAPGSVDNATQSVTRILVMSDETLPLSEIKKRLSEIVDGIEDRHDRVVLTRNGRPAAVLMSPAELESLEETLDILSDPAAMGGIKAAESAIAAGDAVDANELRATYLHR